MGNRGKDSLEEVLIALRVVKRHKPAASFAMLPQIAALMEDILSIRYPDRKAVIGMRFFDVESGINVVGILKKPSLYEPFMPELVGSSRKFVIGKHSGRNSMVVKIAELGLDPGKFDCPALLRAVREESIKKNTGLTDEEFFELIMRHRK